MSPSARPASMQFTVQQMFLLFVPAAIVCGVLAGLVRLLPVEDQMSAAIYALVIFAIGMVSLILACWRRAIIEYRAGPSHYVARSQPTTGFHWAGITGCVFCVVIIGYGLIAIVSNGTYESRILWSIGYPISLVFLFTGGYLVCTFWWKIDPKALDIRENGIAHGAFRFVPWTMLRGFRWKDANSQKIILLTKGGFVEWPVPVGKKGYIEVTLSEYIPFEPAD